MLCTVYVKIQDIQLFSDHLVVYERENGLPKVTFIAFQQLENHLEVFKVVGLSLRTPDSVYDYDMNTGVSVLKKIQTGSKAERPAFALFVCGSEEALNCLIKKLGNVEYVEELASELVVRLWKAIRKLGHIVSSRLSFVVVMAKGMFWSGTAGAGWGLVWSWSPCFTRSFYDWEMEEVEGLLLRLYGQKLILEEDRVQWTETKDGIF
ncbi:hypothetical protein CK203_075465 [Vitis vinifera]|uniref:Uncharacterized protein n=1 Tax=Vitis vinifera TaxID=29760 RepID=A0A438EUF0_VITVI|nr:hypothetical protein CK203_075465 [Vitis vinifera]